MLNNTKPFIKWVGGKRQLIDEIHSRLPETINNYHEPFVGGGAMFFSLNNSDIDYSMAYLSDVNRHLLAAYSGIQTDVNKVIAMLQMYENIANRNIEIMHKWLSNNNNCAVGSYITELNYQKSLIIKKMKKHGDNLSKMEIFKNKLEKLDDILEIENISYYCRKQFYNKLKSSDRKDDFKSWSSFNLAARFIYLNKTCFNGLYRENSKGYFNTPFGDQSSPLICDINNLLACSESLQSTSIKKQSFLDIELVVNSGDFVYFDPPYIPLSSTSSFTGYTSEDFGMNEQTALRDLCIRLTNKGVNFMLSNSSAPLIYDLYKDFTIDEVNATRAINSIGDKRGEIKEVLVYNYSNITPKPFSF